MKSLARMLLPAVLFLFISAAKPTMSPVEMQSQRKFEEFGGWLANKFRCALLKVGTGALVDSKRVAYSLSLADDRLLTIDHVRPLFIAMIQTIERMMEDDPLFESCLKTLARRQFGQSTSLIYDHLGIKLTFWDKEMERPTFPYVADARFVEGHLFFYYADPSTQALSYPIIEPYEMALQKARQPLTNQAGFKSKQVKIR